MVENGSPASLAGDDRAGLLCSAASNPTDNLALAPLQVHAGPSQEAVAACDEFVFNELFHAFSTIESYAVSAKEAARRGDRNEIKLRLRTQLRDCFRYAVQVHNLMSPEQPESSAGRAM
jgi:hypothetical protein